MSFGKQKFEAKQLKINKFLSDVKQLKMNKFIKSIWQLIIKTSNAALQIPSLRPSNQQFSAQSVMITFILFKRHRSIDNSTEFYLFILSWKGPWWRIWSWQFKTLSWITNHDLLSWTLIKTSTEKPEIEYLISIQNATLDWSWLRNWTVLFHKR